MVKHFGKEISMIVKYTVETTDVVVFHDPTKKNKMENIETLFYHREGGLPAAYSMRKENGTNLYCIHFSNGKNHRANGPQIVFNDTPSNTWFIGGQYVDQFLYFAWLEKHGIDINNISKEEEFLILLEWGDNK